MKFQKISDNQYKWQDWTIISLPNVTGKVPVKLYIVSHSGSTFPKVCNTYAKAKEHVQETSASMLIQRFESICCKVADDNGKIIYRDGWFDWSRPAERLKSLRYYQLEELCRQYESLV